MAGLYDPNLSSKIVEGTANLVEATVRRIVKDPLPAFERMVILETIFDPEIIDGRKIEYWQNVLGVSNIQFANVLPRNTVIAQKILKGTTFVTYPMFVFPFFPSHLALPCKPGEMIWTMFENPHAQIKEIAYWLCRITEPHIADDVNHTHHARQMEYSMRSSIVDSEDQPVYELRNGQVIPDEFGRRYVLENTRTILASSEDVFEKLISETDASKITQYESIPRFKKRPGDIVLEGSNNTLIVLGTDRVGPVSNYINDNTNNNMLVPVPTMDMIGNAGSIDIVAGRGNSSITGGTKTSTTRISDGSELKNELAKDKNNLSPHEGNPDFSNDSSRILISQRTFTDINFSLKEHNKKFTHNNSKIEDNLDNGNASIVIKSDKIRIIAKSDVQMMVLGEQSAVNSWASITIKNNGDIVFNPSETGVIKLGGDDADKAILCSPNAVNKGFDDNTGKIQAQKTPTPTDPNLLQITAGTIAGGTFPVLFGAEQSPVAIFASDNADGTLTKGLAAYSKKVLIK